MREKRQHEMPRKNAGADRDRRRECRAGNIVGGGGDAERDNEEGMSLHKILGRSRIMRRGAERDRRCNEITNMYRNSRLTLPLNLKFRIGNDRRNVEGGDGDASTSAIETTQCKRIYFCNRNNDGTRYNTCGRKIVRMRISTM